jgi:hypothetical protein
MAVYRFEARYRGVPRQAVQVVRDHLRSQVGQPGASVAEVRAVGLDARGFYVRMHLRHNSGFGHVVGAIQAGNTQCALALEKAWQRGKLTDDPVATTPYCVSCEALS